MTKKEVLFDLSIAGVICFGIYEVIKHFSKKDEPQQQVNNTTEANDVLVEETTETKTEEKPESIPVKVKKKVKAAWDKTLDFVVEHQVEIDACTSALGLVATMLTIGTSCKTLAASKKEEPKTPPKYARVKNGLDDYYIDGDTSAYDFVGLMGALDNGQITNESLLGDKVIEYKVARPET